MMRAGLLRHRLTIQSPAVTRDSHGGVVKTWATQATVWGSVEPITDREFFDAPRVKATSTTSIKLRGRITVQPTDRIIFQGRIFQVDSVGNFREKGLETTVLATEVVGAGLSVTLALSATAGVAGTTAFTVTATAVGGVPTYTFSTNWGDGTVTTGPTSSHTFNAAGPYTIVLTVVDSAGATVTATGQVVITSSPGASLSAGVSLNLSSGTATVTAFTATATALNGTSPYVYSINWGDGTTTTGATGTHTYATSGTKTVTATVTDAAGATATATTTATVAATLSASLSLSASTGTAGSTVFTATNSAANGTPSYTYSTNWGDGTTSTGGAPTHTYAAGGVYTVTTTATDSLGATATASQSVTITGVAAGTTPSWSAFSLNGSDRKVYVSSSTGSSGNDGLSTGAPKATIAQGLALMRNNRGDWLCLKAGDTFTENINWGTVGRSAAYPTILTSYGTGARPIVSPPAGSNGFDASNNGGAYLAIIGIDFYAATRDPANGTPTTTSSTAIRWYGQGDTFLVEDCRMRFFTGGVALLGTDATHYLDNCTIRGNVVVDNYHDTNHGGGLYATYCKNLIVEDNVFDHNGWNASITGSERDVFSHNIYIDNEQAGGPGPGVGFIVRRNVMGRGASHGLQFRCGGTVADNLAVGNAIGILLGGGDNYAVNSPGGVPFSCTNNVVTESDDIAAGTAPRGFGFDVVNISSGTMSGNIVAHDASASPYTNAHGISIDNPTAGLTLTSNIVWNWHVPKVFESGVGVTETGSTNYYGSYGGPNTPGYTAPSRTVGSYSGTVGGTATIAGFMVLARAQTKASWNANLAADAVNAYIRAGFAT